MARSLSNAKILAALVGDNISIAVNRRGYAAASQGMETVKSSAVSGSAMMKKKGEAAEKTEAWVPDPVTGYYRPENTADDIDSADLRNMLLKQNKH